MKSWDRRLSDWARRDNDLSGMEVSMRAIGFAILVLAAASPAVAQGGEEEPGFGGGDCGWARSASCSTPGGNEAINVFAFHEKGPGWHDECKICKSGGSEVEWSQCHPSCGGGGLDLVFLSIVKAAGNGNVRAVLMLAPYAPRYVDVNLARSSVQVRSCTGAVIANLRFHDADRTSALRIARTGIADAAASHNPSPFDILSPPAGF